MTISYQNRQGRSWKSDDYFSIRDLEPAPKLVIANRIIKNLAGFSIGQRVSVTYSQGQITISKIN
jgi:hypothetical protein